MGSTSMEVGAGRRGGRPLRGWYEEIAGRKGPMGASAPTGIKMPPGWAALVFMMDSSLCLYSLQILGEYPYRMGFTGQDGINNS